MLFNLSKGRLGQEVSETIGRFIIARLKSIAFQRATLPPHLRKPIYLIIDEADTFIDGNSLDIILKETRKFGLHLILCTQNIVGGRDQEKLKRNLLNNTHIKVIGMNGYSTLSPLAKETLLPLKDLQRLQAHQFRIKNGQKKARSIHTKDVL